MKTTTPGSIGGMKVAIAWPNMWLSGSRFRNRSGKNGRPHFRYFSDLALDRHDVGQDVAVGDDDALGLGRRAGREDDLGDVVAPDGRPGAGRAVGPLELVQGPDAARVRARRRLVHGGTSCPTSTSLRRRSGDAREEIGRGAVVDRDDDAPSSRHPQNATIHSGRFSEKKTTLSPFRRPGCVQAGGESARGAADLS